MSSELNCFSVTQLRFILVDFPEFASQQGSGISNKKVLLKNENENKYEKTSNLRHDLRQTHEFRERNV